MNIGIMAAGPKQYLPDLVEHINEIDLWIGVDAGALVLLESSIIPDVAIGDFDSITEKQWKLIQSTVTSIEKFPAEKDETDTELAIKWAIRKGATSIKLFGMTGGRMDHTLANIQVLIKWIQIYSIPMTIVDKQNTLTVQIPGEYYIKSNPKKKYISFFALSPEVTGLTLNNFKYPLEDYTLTLGSTLCTSNEILNEFSYFSFESGILLVIRSND